MGKISKSNTTPEDEALEAEARERLASRKSEHFAEGTYIVVDNRRSRIIKAYPTFLAVTWDDDPESIDTVYPIALQNWTRG